ncbi:signal peptidase I [Sphaerisporangium sp. TRM90804]|uniref:signal peptidase I n=1 Tax=Sphaerisporangium sp. TRM90804 TaxID=3031113 RepID=UPI0024484FA3|nr:signal peptidase I [Sphaerisporangium sp. TRM90804]MDH2430097.1 signal peptidase I [Sphaerisporangium sp. TRM90804]
MTSDGQGAGGPRRPVEDEVDVVAEDTKPTAKDGKEKKGSFWRELPVLVVVALVLALIIKSFVVQAFYIPSESMEDTLLVNDRVLVNKLVYHTRDIERGDIVVFSGVDSWASEVEVPEPTNPVAAFFRWVGTAFGVVPGEKDYIKRVIGVPGDTVKCCDPKGRVTVNGVALDETAYLYPDDQPSQKFFEIKVPKDRLWVMGDHRSVSLDSRSHQGDPGGGTIAREMVVGRAFVIVWPFSRASTLPIPDTFGQSALRAAGAVGGAAPLLLGFAAAFPLMAVRRRVLKASIRPR